MLCAAAFAGDVDHVRRLLESKADVNERDEKDRTPLMLAACGGNLEAAWLLVDAGANMDLWDIAGLTALEMAQERGHDELIELLGGAVKAADAPLMPDDFSSEEEEEGASVEGHQGPAVVLDHRIRLEPAAFAAFQWDLFEFEIARLAGVAVESVYVTPEPGKDALEVHATILKALKAPEVTSTAGIDEIMKTVKALRHKAALQKAVCGASVLAVAEVKLLGEGVDAAEAIAESIAGLTSLRGDYEALRDGFKDPDGGMAARGLSASKAILLLRPSREAIAKAAAKSAADTALRRKRQGGGGGGSLSPGGFGSSFKSGTGTGRR